MNCSSYTTQKKVKKETCVLLQFQLGSRHSQSISSLIKSWSKFCSYWLCIYSKNVMKVSFREAATRGVL